ncbi:MAG: HAD family hydrolase [Anaerolineales bacterium]|nr:HAD family hydrolase [Anaerolineales bacterium]MCB8968853.1 HAD family hydrolase [Ardenticatenaceae bacterium]
MLQAVLFDLDNTLLGNHMDTFMPHYFALLGDYARPIMEKERFLQELMVCTKATMESTDTAVSNRDIFWQTFQARNQIDPNELEQFFDKFYQTDFWQLQSVVQYRPEAATLVKACQEMGLQVVIATNPLFPRRAVEARLAWAGLPVDTYTFDLVTTYDNMHSTKPHLSYYQEILQAINCPPEEALMVGDDWDWDMLPAAALKMHRYWLPPDETTSPPDSAAVTAYGSLTHFADLVQSGWLAQLAEPTQQSMD